MTETKIFWLYYSVYNDIIKSDAIFFNWFLFIIVWKYDCIRILK